MHLLGDRVTWTSNNNPDECISDPTCSPLPLKHPRSFVRNAGQSALMQPDLGSNEAMLTTEIRNEASEAVYAHQRVSMASPHLLRSQALDGQAQRYGIRTSLDLVCLCSSAYSTGLDDDAGATSIRDARACATRADV